METPNDPQPFDYLSLLSNIPKSDLDILFERATTELSEQSWFKTAGGGEQDRISFDENDKIITIEKILPFPYPRPDKSFMGRYSQEEAKWQSEERMWSTQAYAWLRLKKQGISKKIIQAKKLISESVDIINKKYKRHLKASDIFNAWIKELENMPLNEFEKFAISIKNLSPFLAKQANEYKNRLTKITVISVTGKDIEDGILEARKAKRKIVPFSDLLVDFTKEDLDLLLMHLKFKNEQGETKLPEKKKSALHGLLKVLTYEGIVKDASRNKLYNSLCEYLCMKPTDVKYGLGSKAEKSAENRANSYLNKAGYTRK